MRILVDISPIDKNSTSGHKVRGVGKYIELLRDNLEKFDKENTYKFSSNPQVDGKSADVIHYPYFDPFFVTLPILKTRPTVVTVHDLIPLMHKDHFPVGIKGGIKWRFNKKILKGLDAIITDSFASKDDIEQLTDFPSGKIFPIYLPADKELKHENLSDSEKREVKRNLGVPENFLLYVGDVTWNKNLPKIAEAIIKSNIPLVMVGKAIAQSDYDKNNPWNNDRVELQKITEGNSLFKKLGYVSTSDLNLLYNTTLGVLMPSRDEGFGFPVLEGMTCGCPVITSKNGSLQEVGGDAVLYVESDSVASISEGIKKVLNQDVRNALIEKGFEQAKKFTPEKFISETVSVYEKVIRHA